MFINFLEIIAFEENVASCVFQEGVKVETVADESPEISAVKRAKIKRDKMQYGAFIKVAVEILC